MKQKAYLVVSIRNLKQLLRVAEASRAKDLHHGYPDARVGTYCMVLDLEVDSEFPAQDGAVQVSGLFPEILRQARKAGVKLR